jgi:hypothetical protein
MRALLAPGREQARDLVGYRRCALELLRHTATAWTASEIYRRGLRQRDRGCLASGEGWPLLARVLGDRVAEVDPLIVAFYTNPGPFDARATLALNTRPARLASRLATLLMGQGLYECDLREIEAHFRVFRRADGSMHFVRELHCGGALRVFDSDFVVRETPRGPSLFEVFADLGIDIEMDVEPTPGGGVSIRVRRIYARGVPMPGFGLRIEFRSRVVRLGGGEAMLQVDGTLEMRPRTAWGRFLAHGVLRRPRRLGSIHYTARRSGTRPGDAGPGSG